MSRLTRTIALASALAWLGADAAAQAPRPTDGPQRDGEPEACAIRFVGSLEPEPEFCVIRFVGPLEPEPEFCVCVRPAVIPPRPVTRFASQDAEPDDDPTRDRRRVLTLDDGRALRGRCRAKGGRWERRVERAWVPVEGTVVRVRLEQELEAEARRRSSKLGRDAHDERVELARWMLAEGLDREALRELDRVLAKDGAHAGALALIREERIELELGLPPDAHPAQELNETLKHGARGTPAVREVAARRVADYAELVNLRELVLAELKRPQPSRRAFAAVLAQRLYPNELVPDLARRALLDPMSNVRHSAALALRTAQSPTVVDPLASGLLSRYHVVRANAIEALGVVGHPAAVAPLMSNLATLQAAGGAPSGVRGHLFTGLQIALVTDYDVEIAQAASIGDPIVSIQESGVVHDVRAQAQIDRRVELQLTVAALGGLTGHEGKTPEAWLEWWETSGNAWLELQGAPPRPAQSWTPPAPPVTGGAGC